jgi:hypothetical protein
MTSSVPAIQQAQKAAELKLAAISDVDAFSALGLTNIFDYGLFDGTPALLAFLGGDPNQLLADDTNAGYAALSAIDVFFGDAANGEGGVISDGNINALANYDALSAIPVFVDVANAATLNDAITALGGYDALSAAPAFRDFAATGNTDAFIQSDTQPGYAALSALSYYRDGTLGNIDAFSAIPLYRTALDPTADPGDRADAIRGLDAFSAIPAYLNLPTNLPPATLALAKVNPEANVVNEGDVTPVVKQDEVQNKFQAPDNSFKPLAAITSADTAPAAPGPEPTGPPVRVSRNVQGDGNFGKAEPGTKGPLLTTLFGGGGAATDTNDAWHKALHSVGLGGAGASDTSAGGTG